MSVISSRSPSLSVNDLVFLLIMYVFMSLIQIIWYLFFQVFMSSAIYDRKSVMGHSLLLRLEK